MGSVLLQRRTADSHDARVEARERELSEHARCHRIERCYGRRCSARPTRRRQRHDGSRRRAKPQADLALITVTCQGQTTRLVRRSRGGRRVLRRTTQATNNAVVVVATGAPTVAHHPSMTAQSVVGAVPRCCCSSSRYPEASLKAAIDARSRGCHVVLKASPHPALNVPVARRLLASGAIDHLFVNEVEAPALLGWGEETRNEANRVVRLNTLSEAERAAEATLLRWAGLSVVIVTSMVGHVMVVRGPEHNENAMQAVRRTSLRATGSMLAAAEAATALHNARQAQEKSGSNLDSASPEQLHDSSESLDARLQQLHESDSFWRQSGRLHPADHIVDDSDDDSRDDSPSFDRRSWAPHFDGWDFKPVVRRLPKSPLKVIDYIGAADAFVGAFIAARCRRLTATQALLWANAAGTLSTQRRGAQESMPTLEELTKFMTSDLPTIPPHILLEPIAPTPTGEHKPPQFPYRQRAASKELPANLPQYLVPEQSTVFENETFLNQNVMHLAAMSAEVPRVSMAIAEDVRAGGTSYASAARDSATISNSTMCLGSRLFNAHTNWKLTGYRSQSTFYASLRQLMAARLMVSATGNATPLQPEESELTDTQQLRTSKSVYLDDPAAAGALGAPNLKKGRSMIVRSNTMGREDVWQLHGHGGLNKPKLTRGECQTSNLHEVHSTQSLPQAPVEAEEPEEEGDEIPKCTPKAESAILGDGMWLFGEVLPHTATPAELAAQVAIALLRIHAISAPETERDSQRNGALELVTAYVMMVLRGPDGVTRSLGEVPDSELPHDIVECRNALLKTSSADGCNLLLAACGAGADSIVRVLFELDNVHRRMTHSAV